jgi:hypothetical protein
MGDEPPSTEGFTPQQQAVSRLIGAATSDAGCDIVALASSSVAHGMALSDIRDACDFLSAEGHIFPTIDDDHFQLCDDTMQRGPYEVPRHHAPSRHHPWPHVITCRHTSSRVVTRHHQILVLDTASSGLGAELARRRGMVRRVPAGRPRPARRPPRAGAGGARRESSSAPSRRAKPARARWDGRSRAGLGSGAAAPGQRGGRGRPGEHRARLGGLHARRAYTRPSVILRYRFLAHIGILYLRENGHGLMKSRPSYRRG